MTKTGRVLDGIINHFKREQRRRVNAQKKLKQGKKLTLEEVFLMGH